MITLQITPPGGSPENVTNFKNCQVTLAATGKAGSFSVNIISIDDSDIFENYPIGSDVRISMDGNVFRGWILNPTKQLNGSVMTLSLKGLCYTGRTQKVLVTETYTNQKISDIVKDLFSKYAPEYNIDSVVTCDKILPSIKFNDEFLFDVVNELAELAGFEWFIDEPIPEQIDTLSLPAGWMELVETRIHQVFYPSETLYPSEVLYPC